MLEAYRTHQQEREQQGIPPKALTVEQTADLIELIKNPPAGEDPAFLLHLLTECVPPGVDQAAYMKAAFLADVANGKASSPLIDRVQAVKWLGTMIGGYNIDPLVAMLDDDVVGDAAAAALKGTVLIYDAFRDVEDKMRAGNTRAKAVIESWAAAEWFLNKPALAEEITVTVFKVPGETNTDDLSPAQDAWSRPDIPLHALAMLNSKMADGLSTIVSLKEKGHPVAYVGDVVGTGSSRKSAINSVQWAMGRDIPYVPNKRTGGVILGSKIAPIFFNTAEDSGALPIEVNVDQLETGDIVTIRPYAGELLKEGKVIETFQIKPTTLPDEVRAGGRIMLIIGRALTDRARAALNLPSFDVFRRPIQPKDTGKGFTLAQKMVGRACGVEGVRPGTYCEPRMATVGSQDTTGAMTRDELKELACLGFSADLVMQSFCHTAAYPKPVDIALQHELPQFISTRGGVSLRPGDGVIHSWLNRMILPDTVGTGGDSHTRFPIGISFPAGSGLVAFAAALGVMPLDMPESVLVRFKGEMQPGITLRDLVNAIPYVAIQRGLMTVEKKGKKNVFNGRVLEIEGLPNLKVEQAFEFADASAERSANGCTVRLDKAPIIEFLTSNITLLQWMIANGYEDKRTLARRIEAMEQWLARPELLEPDADAEYAEIIEIDLATITEPLLACPNDPDDIKPLSEVQGTHIDEVFIGSCMTNIGHYRAAGKVLEANGGTVPTRLWIAPPTRMDEHQLTEEGYYSIFGKAGARVEMPGCSLCMGNQARVADGATVVSTSTRNFPNRMGKDANVYLASAELSAVAALLGRLPTNEEYQAQVAGLKPLADDIYRYLNFNEIAEYQQEAIKGLQMIKDIPVVMM
ncbi:MAG: bifunctional aconitate hydratase 2/2-methylisocitrate dehydratase [Halothiobacillus sp. 14-56-357]|jgi:aconitate hydratase 2/2-methylisocitrate dehydratase|uniref:bifunctional aconitate hydratase 2/2-methylisocitrate dehydratase n=1 Tax=Halothiobacillus sp. 15-55-196 TaxID=1970382 RepID=UPI000BD14279|nr:bifunctional aconitate hydratase 2/2-methylisocitrate dehydratase [Halothiobacillus sp. 15-55-196]OZB37224.1 MAG: bifunctional aconitate hydratase 2/2-methylisocitrate dehydratase [Halothiobacillus sp. 15-55-196]OZB57486.1 MAG: bifunctional aconitate hydratase 2/2-methylisocitrate dehydratase [Halothiobacillus sp. 14-56-357]OZB78929.1 MAG: bifunctional aconitate hydratase 2/2-methylisocitrate dehydratase [Halothiobacillus sp. 13-55-115]